MFFTLICQFLFFRQCLLSACGIENFKGFGVIGGSEIEIGLEDSFSAGPFFRRLSEACSAIPSSKFYSSSNSIASSYKSHCSIASSKGFDDCEVRFVSVMSFYSCSVKISVLYL